MEIEIRSKKQKRWHKGVAYLWADSSIKLIWPLPFFHDSYRYAGVFIDSDDTILLWQFPEVILLIMNNVETIISKRPLGGE